MNDADWINPAADCLASLYEKKFGGKIKGRYRISARLVREVAGRNRLYEDDVRSLGRALFERGFVLIDMDSFFVVMSANSFVNYRRANEEFLK
jgi:hypothetical protein